MAALAAGRAWSIACPAAIIAAYLLRPVALGAARAVARRIPWPAGTTRTFAS